VEPQTITWDHQFDLNINWYALDRDGRLGAFCAGLGPIPAFAREHWQLGRDIYAWLMQLPENRSASVDKRYRKMHMPAKKFNRDCFLDILDIDLHRWGKRGICLYQFLRTDPDDDDPVDGPYQRVIQPDSPLLLEQLPLPREFQSYFDATRIPGSFQSLEDIPVSLVPDDIYLTNCSRR
jgi:hypothetical protein